MSTASSLSVSFESIPVEVLENIAYFAATATVSGPPSSIPVLLLLSRHINSVLSFQNNPHLYARIFAAKLDLGAPLKRLGNDELTVMALADELRWRFRVLKKIKAKQGCFLPKSNEDEESSKSVPSDDKEEDLLSTYNDTDSKLPSYKSQERRRMTIKILWCAYLMILENNGKNDIQLREYAKLDEWIKLYWFHPNGASGVGKAYEERRWPSWDSIQSAQDNKNDIEDDESTTTDDAEGGEEGDLAMWLFWFLLRPETFAQDQELYRTAMYILKPLALGAHKVKFSSLVFLIN